MWPTGKDGCVQVRQRNGRRRSYAFAPQHHMPFVRVGEMTLDGCNDEVAG